MAIVRLKGFLGFVRSSFLHPSDKNVALAQIELKKLIIEEHLQSSLTATTLGSSALASSDMNSPFELFHYRLDPREKLY